jgi:hypothetical protein
MLAHRNLIYGGDGDNGRPNIKAAAIEDIHAAIPNTSDINVQNSAQRLKPALDLQVLADVVDEHPELG